MLAQHEQNIPHHVAMIMDGNGRWAEAQGEDRTFGHMFVAEQVLEAIIKEAIEVGIQVLTLWAFSTENWKRPEKELHGLMRLLARAFALKNIQKLNSNGVQIETIGDLTKFSPEIQGNIAECKRLTAANRRLKLIFALNYGGQGDIARANKRARERDLINDDSTEEEIIAALAVTNDLADIGVAQPDLIIRTGPEQRLSGFLPFAGYAELIMGGVVMPELTPAIFRSYIEEFGQRTRTFGGVKNLIQK